MVLGHCDECEGVVSSQSQICLRCGATNPNYTEPVTVGQICGCICWIVALIGVAVALVWGWLNPDVSWLGEQMHQWFN